MTSRIKGSYRIHTVEQALDILEAISEIKGEVSLSDLGQKLKINKSTLFRFMTTFEQRGYLELSATTARYRVGVTAAETCRKLLLRMDFLSNSKPTMELLARECNEDIYLAVHQNEEILLLDAVLSMQKIQIVPLVGNRYPLKGISAGKVVLAYKNRHLDVLPDDADIVQQGACIDHELMGEGVSSIAVPLLNGKKELSGCLCVIGPTYRFTNDMIHEELLPRIKQAGQTISTKLGCTVVSN